MSEPGRPGPPRTPTELFDCDRVSAYLESYLLGQVPPPERRGMRLHIHRCPECFAQVTERDPLQLFAPLADQERPAA
ncbi:MAG TPA: zf-HC2 domain-containing protein, partial [Candidatus Polarisedimenticolia bacterium]|nr:zf-HC2 domain-containing protein [Candidatus Polarisedimenticolia bacterium]